MATCQLGTSSSTSRSKLNVPSRNAMAPVEQTFLRPSYLANSPHVERLRARWQARLAESKEQTAANKAQKGTSLSRNTSSASLKKGGVRPYHRTPVQDVIERIPPPSAPVDDRLAELPSRFSDTDKMSGLEILANGSEVRFNGVTKTSDEAASVRAITQCQKSAASITSRSRSLVGARMLLLGLGSRETRQPQQAPRLGDGLVGLPWR